ncbi:MAG: hypothetical protein HKN68_22720 [Saprospiraceae bacterium]|nr:hypothetical protein [Saprospiraceae bacterium]
MRSLFTISLIILSSQILGQLDLLNDEFDRPCSLQSWNNINITEGWNAEQLEHHDIGITNDGSLTMIPYTSSWYADYRGILLYKLVSGNFIFETEVSVTNRTETGLPSSDYSLAGMMIRTPKSLVNGATGWTPGMENYVFLALGYASTSHPSCSSCPGPHFEVKNTINSNSNLSISNIPQPQATIRMMRVNGAIIVLRRLPGGNFTVHARYNRQDMPSEVQLGFVTYTDWPNVNQYNYITQNSNVLNDDFDNTVSWNPDLIGTFDYARFDDVSIPPHLQGLNFSNPSQVSDYEILNNFTYDLTATFPWQGKIWKGVNNDWNDPTNWTDNSMPIPSDSLLIPDCSCPSVACPTLPSGVHQYAALIIDQGGHLNINQGASLEVNLSDLNWRFRNNGTIINNGNITITRPQGHMIVNTGSIINNTGSNFEIIDP